LRPLCLSAIAIGGVQEVQIAEAVAYRQVRVPLIVAGF
jgi:hypothetical protein